MSCYKLTWRLTKCFHHKSDVARSLRELSTLSRSVEPQTTYDVVIVGAGHNGLISAAYLQKAGLNVCVLERRHVIGGAAVTEEIVPGCISVLVVLTNPPNITQSFKFSRASYLLSLLRPDIISDLELKRRGLKVYLRDPSSYTPLIRPGGKDGTTTSLAIYRDKQKTANQIAQFSAKDAQRFCEYETQLERIVRAIDPLLDSAPPHLSGVLRSWRFRDKLQFISEMKPLIRAGAALREDFLAFYELMTSPATKVLDQWFESEPLKATLATDSVIGAMVSPHMIGSGYVLLHHVMGGVEGVSGAWGYVEGGMGGVSQAIAASARDHGASIFTDKSVSEIVVNSQGQTTGVVLQDGTEVKAKMVLSNATPKVTFLDLLPQGSLSDQLTKEISQLDYTSPVTKINVAVNKLPNFLADPNSGEGPMPHHQATIHINCEETDLLHQAYLDAQMGKVSNKPMIEMVIPSSLDPTLAPPGGHVVLLFTQYTPYCLVDGKWDEATKNSYADNVFADIEMYAPGFTESVVGRDILTPPDLEKTFGLTGGNIFHGALSLDQLYLSRPVPRLCNYSSPIKGLYLCGSGAHPGGGVLGAAGRLAALEALKDWKWLNSRG